MVIMAGKLRHKLDIQQDTGTQNAYNEIVENWVSVFKPYGSIDPFSGSETFDSNYDAVRITHEIRIRYDSRVSEKMRVAFNGRYFYIEYILNKLERNRELRLLCEERK